MNGTTILPKLLTAVTVTMLTFVAPYGHARSSKGVAFVCPESTSVSTGLQVYRLPKGRYEIETNRGSKIPARCIQRWNDPMDYGHVATSFRGEFKVTSYRSAGESPKRERLDIIKIQGLHTPAALLASIITPEPNRKYVLEVTGPYLLIFPPADGEPYSNEKADSIYSAMQTHDSLITAYDAFRKLYDKDLPYTIRQHFENIEWAWLDKETPASASRAKALVNLVFAEASQELLQRNSPDEQERNALMAMGNRAALEYGSIFSMTFQKLEIAYNCYYTTYDCYFKRVATGYVSNTEFVNRLNAHWKAGSINGCKVDPNIKITAAKEGAKAEASFSMECDGIGGMVSINSEGQFEVSAKGGVIEIAIAN